MGCLLSIVGASIRAKSVTEIASGRYITVGYRSSVPYISTVPFAEGALAVRHLQAAGKRPPLALWTSTAVDEIP